MDAPSQLKYLAQYLDPHLLYHLLSHNIPSQSEAIRSQLKASFSSHQNEAQATKREQESLQKAQKLMTLLQSQANTEQVRKDKEFTFDKLR